MKIWYANDKIKIHTLRMWRTNEELELTLNILDQLISKLP